MLRPFVWVSFYIRVVLTEMLITDLLKKGDTTQRRVLSEIMSGKRSENQKAEVLQQLNLMH